MRDPVIRIHPAIGIARLGNSEEAFVGPELPGRPPSVKQYRDRQGRLKRQAARFRLFLDGGRGRPREITLDDPSVRSIEWTIHVKNTKAAAPRCSGILKTKSTWRNARFKNRALLVLDPKPLRISGPNSRVDGVCSRFMGRSFARPLVLCSLRTDSRGRLLFLGGYGRAGSLIGAPLDKRNGNDFANHDGWYDDTSDGSIDAIVTFQNNARIRAKGSWVIVAPPKYAPGLENIVTLYDTLYQKAIDDGHEPDPFRRRGSQFRPSFREDIYPILRRAAELRWVFARMAIGHEHQFSWTRARKDPNFRRHLFAQFRTPSRLPKKPGTGVGLMPYVWSDLFPYPVNGTLTRHQYKVLNAWAEGKFIDDWRRQKRRQTALTPEAIDRAALEACVGGPFYPGIECSFHLRDKFRYTEKFRLDRRSLRPGDVAAQMSLPWQSDFVDCSDGDKPFVWWPAQRPIDVLADAHSSYPTVRWARDFVGGSRDMNATGMVRHWHRLGLVERKGDRYVETQRI